MCEKLADSWTSSWLMLFVSVVTVTFCYQHILSHFDVTHTHTHTHTHARTHARTRAHARTHTHTHSHTHTLTLTLTLTHTHTHTQSRSPSHTRTCSQKAKDETVNRQLRRLCGGQITKHVLNHVTDDDRTVGNIDPENEGGIMRGLLDCKTITSLRLSMTTTCRVQPW